MNVFLPDGSPLTVPEDATVRTVAQTIGPGLAKAAIAGKVGDRVVDLTAPVHEGDRVAIVTLATPEGIDILRHSSAHVLAEAATRAYPGTKVAIGPAIKDGFYYDFEFPQPITEEDLARIEQEANRAIKAREPFERREVTREEALALFADEPYKTEIIDELPEGSIISLYRQGDFLDLCRGPHLPDTGRIPAFKVLSTAGAYWRGDAQRPMLTRIYGTAFPSKKDLEDHLARLEMAKPARPPEAGPGAGPLQLPRRGPGVRLLSRPGHAGDQRPAGLLAARSTAGRATRRSRRPSSSIGRCGSAPAIGTTTKTTCTSPRSTTWTSR